MIYSPQEVRQEMRARGHVVFENDTRDYNLNIVGVRTPKPEIDKFKCELHVMWKFSGEWTSVAWPITTLPGRYYMIDRLLNWEGCAILAPGQYRGTYARALHRGKYYALCQRFGEVTVFRDGNRDEVFDMRPTMRRSGWYGINIHRAGWNGKAPKVGRNSAGCQVFQNSGDFDTFMRVIEKSLANFNNRFTYTLLDGHQRTILSSLSRI